MFINDVKKKEDIRKIAILTLRKFGIKFREKQHRHISQIPKSTRFFKIHLQSLENETITLKNGQQLIIPKQLYEICSFIFSQVETEGIFRKEGSRSRQHEIKLLLDRGCLLHGHHVIDVAVVLKYFLRELPEPLIPYSFHELFLRCTLIANKVEAILLACLLLPTEHLNVLSFLMQFFSEVASHSHYNKMNSCNIATVVGPNIFPISEKIDPKKKLIVTKSCNIIKIMIENCNRIGEIPEYIIEQIGSSRILEQGLDLKTKRRSGSFTRIFHGLKRMVGNKSEEEISNAVTPDLLLTPSYSYSTKRCQEDVLSEDRTKEDHITKKNGVRKVLDRRWSSVTQSATKRKRRNSLIDISSREHNDFINGDVKTKNLNEFLKNSETEYEEIKSRVYKIEKELSRELNMGFRNPINNIQTAYEQTLVQTEPLSPTTDHLARRLSKELRIRTTEQKIIRSPSARKIGNIKRRSRELDKPSNKIFKSSSVQLSEIKQMDNDLIKSSPSVRKEGDNLNIFLINKDCRKPGSFHGTHKLNVVCSTAHLLVQPSDEPKINGYIKSKTQSSNRTILPSKPCKSTDLTEINHICSTKCVCVTTENLSNNAFSSRDPFKIRRKSKEKLIKPNIPPVKRNISLKQKRKTDKVCISMRRWSMNSKENLMTTEASLEENIGENKYLEKYHSSNIPHIKKSLIIKSPKRTYVTPSKNTPLKVVSASQCFNSNISF